MKVKCKNVASNRIVEKTFRANEKVVQAIVEKKTMQFLYKDKDMYVFMDTSDYSQINVFSEDIGTQKDFFIEGEEVDILMYEKNVLDIELPPKIKMKVTSAAPGLKGDSVSGATKKVEVQSGLNLNVPLFVNEGDSIIIDTRTMEYIGRAD